MPGFVRHRRVRRDWLPYVLGVALVAALVLLLAALTIRGEHDRRRQYASEVTRNLALLIEAQLAGVLAQADLRLQALGAQLPAESGGWSAGLPTPAPGLRINGPLRDEAGRWVIQLARPAARSGDAVVQLSLPVEQLGAILERVNLGRYGAATLRTANLALVYRQPLPAGGLTNVGSTEVSAQLREAIAASPEAGDYVAPTALDGVSRINAYQRVDGYPFYVLVGLPEDDFPRGWGPLDAALLATAVVTLLSAAAGAAALLRFQRRRIGEAQRRFEAIVTSSHDAILSKALNGKVLSWNAAAERILGWSAEEMIGQPMQRIIPPDKVDEERDIIAMLQRGEGIDALRTERLHRDGRRIPMQITISPIREPDGRISGASTIARDITAQLALEAEIRDLAFHDPLTRLPNRRLLLDRLHQAQQSSRRHRQWGAVIFLDLDRFKQLNDTHGHEVGDLYLVEIARRLKGVVRETDTVARLGGDEFVLLCTELGRDEGGAREAVWAVEAKVAHAVAAPWQLRDIHHVSRSSVGHRLFLGADEDAAQLLRDADTQMYQDKQRHRTAG